MNPNEQVTSIKYDEISKVRKHIMEIHDIAEKLNDLRTIVSENFLIQFILNSLLSHFIQFKIYYNTHKESWSMNKLISQCVCKRKRD